MRGVLLLPLVAVSACEFQRAGLTGEAPPDGAPGAIDGPPARFDAPPPDAPPPDAPPPDADPCPPSYLSTPFGCYRAVASAVNFFDAENDCEDDGAHLIVIDGGAENAFVATIATPPIWIGLTDRASEGAFLWVTDAAPTYTQWNSGEPNNFWGEDCAEYLGNMTWNDLQCGGPRAYVCEFDGVPGGTSWQ